MKNIMLFILISIITIQLLKADLQVYNNKDLEEQVKKINKKEAKIPFQLALFGKIPYGRKIIGDVMLANPIDACKPLESTENNQQHTFVLIQRGECSFVTKVFNAQLFGGKVIILMDDKKENYDILMSDDGMGDRVIIPSIFIHFEYGNLLKSLLEDKKQVTLQIEFEENKYKKSDYIFWISLPSITVNKLIYNFNQVRKNLKGNNVQFEPSYDIYVCFECQLEQFANPISDCILNGRFCANDPDLPNIGQINSRNIATGKNVVEESLRQICIFDQDEELWWEYMLIFAQECDKPQLYEVCSQQLVIQIKNLDQEEFKKCYNDNIKNPNSPLLKRQLDLQSKYRINTWPSVTINDLVYRGNLDGNSIMEAICSSLEEPKEECEYYVDPLKQRVEQISNLGKNNGATIIIIVIVMLFCFVVLFVLMACLYRRFFKKEMQQDMNNQINQMVSQYVAFYDQKKIKANNKIFDFIFQKQILKLKKIQLYLFIFILIIFFIISKKIIQKMYQFYLYLFNYFNKKLISFYFSRFTIYYLKLLQLNHFHLDQNLNGQCNYFYHPLNKLIQYDQLYNFFFTYLFIKQIILKKIQNQFINIQIYNIYLYIYIFNFTLDFLLTIQIPFQLHIF
ncbi:vacuolar sorting receptor, putative [Ichthyophthirius multifiliis]|uniref:Vacuolar sorting receptor, putative n=1 Tax=Ichthyophthirius multifiliis TaxID=5932 RepID=G0QQV9_ICHMU|nr:vacuolar sorting receptor, putative [Ichthyophthirius multifiliis]EGR32389.1 vacuolar sorting receptor, putative [Ichthyophthirius multifiliis]|eukprot:XP_004035875.1 vacuolar sorting receptor, putative [Ichthyophthirius multifiliis]